MKLLSDNDQDSRRNIRNTCKLLPSYILAGIILT